MQANTACERLLLIAALILSTSCRSRQQSSGALSDADSSVNPGELHEISSDDAIHLLLTYGPSYGTYNGKQNNGSLCKLITEPGGDENRYSQYSVKIHKRTGTLAEDLIKSVVIDANASIQFQKIEQDQPGNTGNKRWLNRFVVSAGNEHFTLEECIYQGLEDFDLTIVAAGQRISCNKRFDPLVGWPECM